MHNKAFGSPVLLVVVLSLGGATVSLTNKTAANDSPCRHMRVEYLRVVSMKLLSSVMPFGPALRPAVGPSANLAASSL